MRTSKAQRQKRSSAGIAFWTLLVLFFLSGGGLLASQEDLTYKGPRARGADVPSVASGGDGSRIEKDASKGEKGYVYNPVGKTDPFKSFVLEQKLHEEQKAARPKTYLETLDISQLDLIAIILNPKGNWAMVRDAKGLGHVIRKGTLIGTNGGVVREIKDGEVVVREQYRDFRGQVIVKDISKKLPSLE